MGKRITRPRIYTLGHSNRSFKEFIDILKTYKLKLVVDVRTVPKSLHNPQYSGSRFKQGLKRHGVEYIHMAGLGGFRRVKKDSPNKAWRNKSFQGYADYMLTEEFEKNLKRLINRSKRKRLVIVCAEAVPWRCHRSLISDALSIKGITAEEILSETSHRAHKRTRFMKVKNSKPIYPHDP